MNFWDKKYSTQAYGYGLQANAFFAEIISKISPGKVLLPGEGEGRNAVYAAKKGWIVTAFDTSEVAIKNALILAEKNNVSINYQLDSVESFENQQQFDLIAVIFLHLLPDTRKRFHAKLIEMLSDNGKLILEVFAKEQIQNNSGGPKNLDLLYDIEQLRNDFSAYNIEMLKQMEVVLDEGEWHKGKANIIRAIVSK